MIFIFFTDFLAFSQRVGLQQGSGLPIFHTQKYILLLWFLFFSYIGVKQSPTTQPPTWYRLGCARVYILNINHPSVSVRVETHVLYTTAGIYYKYLLDTALPQIFANVNCIVYMSNAQLIFCGPRPRHIVDSLDKIRWTINNFVMSFEINYYKKKKNDRIII